MANGERILRPSFLGLVGIAGVFAPAATNLAGMLLVEGHNPIADTISSLAAGNPHAWLQDAGLIVFGIGLAALGIGLWRWGLDETRWRWAAVLMGLAAPAVFMIAGYNEYGDADSKGRMVHYGVVAVFALLVGLTPWLMASGLTALSGYWRWLGPLLSIAWIVLAPMLLLVPTAYDGGYERLLGTALLVWIGWISYLLWQRG